MTPRVTVVCLCYNHARFVAEALDSVKHQTYPSIDLIIVDDASTDLSQDAIVQWMNSNHGATFLPLPVNLGNCRAFNAGLRKAQGAYVIDLAADDVLLPQRIARGVELLESLPDTGIQFSDAELIDEQGTRLGYHSDRFPHASIPHGWVFRDVVSRYFINSPTMMIRRSLLDELGGYDEALAYEDFDLWVRASRIAPFAYLPEVLVKRRVLRNSLGKRQFSFNSMQSRSTFAVCQKALALCRSQEDLDSVRHRAAYEFRRALVHGEFRLAWSYLRLRSAIN
jgi:glycosyltransferase involved in cell wall biosynthesis